MGTVVSDAGPLIALARIGQLCILPKLFQRVLIPPCVASELQISRGRPGAEELAEAEREGWLSIVDEVGATTDSLPAALDAGEAQAVALAFHHVCPLLIDERRGRQVARQQSVQVIGTGRILISAKEHGLIASVGPILQQLAGTGYWLSERLCRRILELAHE